MKHLGIALVFLLFISGEAFSGSYFLYVDCNANPDVIYRVNNDGTNKTAIYTAPNTSLFISFIAIDASESKLYFYMDNLSYSEGKIFKCDLSGWNPTVFLDVSTTEGVYAIAAGGGYLYYTPYTTRQLFRIKSDNTDQLLLHTAPPTGFIQDVALDLANSLLYFYQYDNATPYVIYKSNLIGTVKSIVHNNGSWSLNSLSAGNGYFFFSTNNTPFSFSRTASNGTGKTTIFTPSGGTVESSAYDPVNLNLYFHYLSNIYKTNSTGGSPGIILNTGTSIVSGNLAVAPNVILPVELTSFTGSASGKKVTLNWITATEVKNHGFNIERRLDPTSDNWEKIGFVLGNGNSNSNKEYSFTDKPSGGEKFQYRLKQIDTDGTFKYSSVVDVQFNPESFELKQNYPNPFNPSTKIGYSVPSAGRIVIKIYDLLGRELNTLLDSFNEAGNHEIDFNAQNLPGGVYFYKLTSNNVSETRKMILIR